MPPRQRKDPVFSSFNKPMAPKMTPVAMHAIETNPTPAATQAINKETETTIQKANTSPFTGFFVSKPNPNKGQAVKSLPPVIIQAVPAKATTTRAFVPKKQNAATTCTANTPGQTSP